MDPSGSVAGRRGVCPTRCSGCFGTASFPPLSFDVTASRTLAAVEAGPDCQYWPSWSSYMYSD